MKIYIRKIDKQFIEKQVSYTKDILSSFLDSLPNNAFIKCEGMTSKTVERVQILLATDPRFSNGLQKVLRSEGDFEIGDLMLMHKHKDKYVIELVNKSNTRYQSYSSLFGEERHSVLYMEDKADDNIKKLLNFNVFGMHIKGENSALSDDNPHVCIGWSQYGDLKNVASKDALRNTIESSQPNSSKNSVGQQVGQIWRFINEMQIGDFVVLGDKSIANIGKITTGYYYDDNIEKQSKDYASNRGVQWLKAVPYSDLSINFKNSLGSAMSVFSLNEYKSYILELLQNEIADAICNEEKTLYDSGENIMFYGVPGCGKSYFVENDKCRDISESFKERVTFHPDYTYGDFVGQLLPKTDEHGKIMYKFIPGPFTNILRKAYENPAEHCVLIIEEINRGNAAAIFGDLFQLLDRKNGRSEYGITNDDIMGEISDFCDEDKVYIPGNLSIYATLNTSDQNVYILDTAFKRRWTQQLIKNDISNCNYKDKIIIGEVTWSDFFTSINAHISLLVEKQICEEDKMMGAYFVKESDIDDSNLFAGKVLSYLWNDVVKYNRSEMFNTSDYKTLSELTDGFIENGLKVFNSNNLDFYSTKGNDSNGEIE